MTTTTDWRRLTTREARLNFVGRDLLDALQEVGNGTTNEELHVWADVLLWVRDGAEPDSKVRVVLDDILTMTVDEGRW